MHQTLFVVLLLSMQPMLDFVFSVKLLVLHWTVHDDAIVLAMLFVEPSVVGLVVGLFQISFPFLWIFLKCLSLLIHLLHSGPVVLKFYYLPEPWHPCICHV